MKNWEGNPPLLQLYTLAPELWSPHPDTGSCSPPLPSARLHYLGKQRVTSSLHNCGVKSVQQNLQKD